MAIITTVAFRTHNGRSFQSTATAHARLADHRQPLRFPNSTGMMTTLEKSSRHSKITGDMGEALVCYLLSKAGWEIGRFDHTGIDLIARRNGKRLGISVKARSRFEQRNNVSINLPRKNIEYAN